METHVYTPIADLVVEHVGPQGQRNTFLVSSANLRVASPVWRTSLDPDSKFASLDTISIGGEVYKKITIKGVGLAALRMILGIIHYDTKDIPTELESGRGPSCPSQLSFGDLRDIALLIDEYDCAKLVTPWVRRWIKRSPTFINWLTGQLNYERVGDEDWFFIASVFKRLAIQICDIRMSGDCEDIIELLSKGLIKTIYIDSNEFTEERRFYRWKERDKSSLEGIRVQIKGDKTFDLVQISLDTVPAEILDFIIKTWSSHGLHMVTAVYTFVQELLNANVEDQGSWACKNPECRAIALGSLIHSLQKQSLGYLLERSLWPDELFPNGRDSLENTVLRIEGLQMTTLRLKDIHKENSSAKLNQLPNVINSGQHPLFLQSDLDLSAAGGKAARIPYAR
ncbi:hypothetical protein TWF730_009248 [Orbilia blumenaviensis]|uniref:Uncharacterized protein n=1 Tax=Orbilia blumenaviensis TaxID=1796055 RepID=A0AAV9UXR4_9PEZI